MQSDDVDPVYNNYNEYCCIQILGERVLTDELLPMPDIKDIGKELITRSKLKLRSDDVDPVFNKQWILL